MTADYRQQLPGFLVGLDQSHLADQCFQSASSLIRATAHPINAYAFLRVVLSKADLAVCSRTARKHRYRSAAPPCNHCTHSLLSFL